MMQDLYPVTSGHEAYPSYAASSDLPLAKLKIFFSSTDACAAED